MSVNDIITSGARPMFFLDYFACGKLDVDTAEQVCSSVVPVALSLVGRHILQCPPLIDRDGTIECLL
jgi:phosphoribosylaminoimidazole (AIR) synthetase